MSFSFEIVFKIAFKTAFEITFEIAFEFSSWPLIFLFPLLINSTKSHRISTKHNSPIIAFDLG